MNVIGAGLAGCEAAYQVASMGIEVNLFDMKPSKMSPAHSNKNFGELVCSNSLKADRIDSASGLLKEEMRRLDSLLMKCADKCRVPAGGALAVDRDKFSFMVTEEIKNNKYINIIEEEIKDIPEDEVTIISTGPLTSDDLAKNISEMCGGSLSFFDAAAPIITKESIDMDKAFKASRYNKGGDDAYINCPLSKEEYNEFYTELVNAERAMIHGFEKDNPNVYEGCMPVEVLASRGIDTLRFGPLKPVGLIDPSNNKRPYAVVQLRMENSEGSLYNMVGFQTNLKFGEQKRVFSLIQALKEAEFVRYGVMHRNTFIDSPRLLNSDYSFKKKDNIYFAGQICGVEGYMESASSGILAGLNAAMKILGRSKIEMPNTTMIGALSRYISDETVKDFQPMGANFGIIPPLNELVKDKKERYRLLSERSLQDSIYEIIREEKRK